ncbi:hypothetical protein [Nodosilinea nodulosa]|uniref:hypothetical protein n=1 Tax=Nodosilinea nodulosa TaxID=416001 RepID=UPI000308C1DD|nr:hypothetical protein [Nodosilinea nodulosa]
MAPQIGDILETEIGYKFDIKHIADGELFFGRPAHPSWSQAMPIESWPHFCADLRQEVYTGLTTSEIRALVKSDHLTEIVLALVEGRGEWLERGNSGNVFRYGTQAIKVSSTVPYHPENPGHLTIKESVQQLKREFDTCMALLDLDIPGILPAHYRVVGEKAFMFMPFIEIATKENPMTELQCRAIAKTIHRLHGAKYVYGDSRIQAGLWNGLPFLIDLGEAMPYTGQGKRSWCRRRDDISALNRFFEEMGHVPYILERSRAISDKKIEAFRNKVRPII